MIGVNQFPEYKVPGAVQHQFNPYENNGGSIVAIAGDDFAVIGADTRLSAGYNIFSRDHSKLFTMTSKAVLASCGNWGDSDTLSSFLKYKVQQYADAHENREISLNALAQLMSTMMYGRRFFPYYVSNILAGTYEGKGYVYSYDPIGHCERHTYRAGGSSAALLQPILDNQIGLKNMEQKPNVPLTVDRAVDLVTDAFISAAERDIYTGDGVNISIITNNGVENRRVQLRKD
ncbi:CLUMA_CG008961, isoform A [Clunio marinus]|uniref:Proteasome subunit beta n=1 Tax=Clunio marinus TaxID=568069 RepID=A0A1J1I7D4_9DIPT|nr:CLUMA_CG008961, isoform A [Clunio marinus]